MTKCYNTLMPKGTFGALFKKYRLKAEFPSLTQFGKALGEKGYLYDDSLFYHWQRNSRIPKNRSLLFSIISLFWEKGGISSLKEVNQFLESAGHGYITESEMHKILHNKSNNEKLYPKKIIKFIEMIGKSKVIPRTGWVMNNIPHPESVAEHSFRVSVLAMVFADQLGADRGKLIQMALLHDLGEVITGDLVWSRGTIIDIKKRAEKEQMEKNGIESIFKLIGLSSEYKMLFEEMVGRQSLEAIVFRQLDKLELAIQALEYEKAHGKNLDEFFLSAEVQITTPFLKNIMKNILKQRPSAQKKTA